MVTLSIVIPCYNEATNIEPLYRALCGVCPGESLEFLFINDGSTDDTLVCIQRLQQLDNRIHSISFIWNSGQQAALRAGIRHARGNHIVTIDADLQQDPLLINEMIRLARNEQVDIVQMKHVAAQKGFFKEPLSRVFRRIFFMLSGIHLEDGVSDFRLISRRVADSINQLPERTLFIRGLIQSWGFPMRTLQYDLHSRLGGKPGYTFRKSFKLAYTALFTFANFAAGFFIMGILLAGTGFLYAFYSIFLRLTTDRMVPGYTDIITWLLFLGGVIIILLSLIAKYLQIALEHLKGRPEYIIDTEK